MDVPGTAWLIWVLATIAVPVVVIFIALGVLRWSRMRAQKAVRSEEYWEEPPDGQRYPTGYEQMYDPEARRAATRGEHPEDEEPGAEGTAGGAHAYGEDEKDRERGDEGSPDR